MVCITSVYLKKYGISIAEEVNIIGFLFLFIYLNIIWKLSMH